VVYINAKVGLEAGVGVESMVARKVGGEEEVEGGGGEGGEVGKTQIFP